LRRLARLLASTATDRRHHNVDLRVQQASVTEIDTPLLVVGLFEGETKPGGPTAAVDTALGGQISRLIAGGEISVTIKLKNTGNVPLRTQGPDSGYTYTTNDSYSSIEGGRYVDAAGRPIELPQRADRAVTAVIADIPCTRHARKVLRSLKWLRMVAMLSSTKFPGVQL